MPSRKNLTFHGVTFEQNFFRSSWGRKLEIENCKFVDCTVLGLETFGNVTFSSCSFENCKFGDADPVYLREVAFRNCEFSNCVLLLSGNQSDGTMLFSDTSFYGGKTNYFWLLGAKFTNVRISLEMNKFVLLDCEGTSLSLLGSTGNDAIVMGLTGFDEIKFPESTDRRVWSTTWCGQTQEMISAIEPFLSSPNAERLRYQNQPTKNMDQRLVFDEERLVSFTVSPAQLDPRNSLDILEDANLM